MAKKSKKTNSAKKSVSPGFAEKFSTALKDRSFHAGAGIFLALFGVYLFGSFVSFFVYWQSDYSEVHHSFWDVLSNSDIRVRNFFGRLGAAFSHLFIFHWFGVGAFFVAAFIFLIGLRVSFKSRWIKLLRYLRNGSFYILWITAFLGYLSGSAHSVYAGGLGYNLNQWMRGIFGSAGTGLFLLAVALVFLGFRFRWTPEKLNALITRLFAKKEVSEETEVSDDFIAQGEMAGSETELASPDSKAAEGPVELNFGEGNEDPSSESENADIELEPQPQKTEAPTDDDELTLDVETVEEKSLDESELDEKVKEFGEYDPTLDLAKYQLPSIDLLIDHGSGNIKIDQGELEANKNKIVETLNNYKIDISKIKATIGPTVTLYEIIPAAGVRISKIKNLEDDIALSLSALGIRIIAPIPGKGTIGIEVPNKEPSTVGMRAVLSSEKFQNAKMDLPLALGKTISNETLVTDLAKMPHLLMAGATGQGKSVGLNAILASILYKKHPSQVKFVLVDPKKVELTLFNKIERHYLAKLPDSEEAIITDTSKVISTLNSLCIEMDQRYELLKEAMVRNIKEYNVKFIQRKLNPEKGHRYLPYIILVIDEFADLIMTAGKEVETPIARLAQLARAIGIHLIIATQRPSVNVITGIIKANFPARIAFRVTSKIDSRTILDTGGAEQLIGKGDLLLSTGNDIIRVQCAFIDTPEVEKICDFIGSQRAYPTAYELPEYVSEEGGGGDINGIDPEERDSMFEEAARIVVIHQQGSASLLQRKLKLGYNRAGRIVDQLEAAGIIGPFEGSKARQVLVQDESTLEQILNRGKGQ